MEEAVRAELAHRFADASVAPRRLIFKLANDTEAMGRAQEYGRLYADLPKETALRTLRFWRMRRQSTELAA
jgi:uncharacterized protein (DUF2336 family)